MYCWVVTDNNWLQPAPRVLFLTSVLGTLDIQNQIYHLNFGRLEGPGSRYQCLGRPLVVEGVVLSYDCSFFYKDRLLITSPRASHPNICCGNCTPTTVRPPAIAYAHGHGVPQWCPTDVVLWSWHQNFLVSHLLQDATCSFYLALHGLSYICVPLRFLGSCMSTWVGKKPPDLLSLCI